MVSKVAKVLKEIIRVKITKNQADWVDSGSSISTVGTSPLNGSGLYFEIRKNGKAMDTAVWLKR